MLSGRVLLSTGKSLRNFQGSPLIVSIRQLRVQSSRSITMPPQTRSSLAAVSNDTENVAAAPTSGLPKGRQVASPCPRPSSRFRWSTHQDRDSCTQQVYASFHSRIVQEIGTTSLTSLPQMRWRCQAMTFRVCCTAHILHHIRQVRCC